MIYGWSPTLASPTMFGWITVLSYFLVMLLCARNARNVVAPARPGPAAFFKARAQRRVWLTLAIVLFLLGLNKQTDLQTLMTIVGRAIARQQGWYGERRHLQRNLIVVIGAIAIVLCGFLYLVIRRAGLWAIVATVDTVLLCAFILVRTASLHDVDLLLGRGAMGITVNLVIEMGAIALDAVAALLA